MARTTRQLTNASTSRSEPTDRPPRSILSGKRLISVETALALTVAIIGIPATFFATRAQLESRVSKIESELEMRLRLRDELDRGFFQIQRNLLELMASVVQRVRSEIGDGQPIEITWEPMLTPSGFFLPPPNSQKPDVIKTISPAVRAIDTRALATAIGSPSFMAIDNSALVRAGDDLARALAQYSTSIARAAGAMPNPMDVFVPELRPGLPRANVEPALTSINSARSELHRVIASFNFDTAIAAELSRIERILDRSSTSRNGQVKLNGN